MSAARRREDLAFHSRQIVSIHQSAPGVLSSSKFGLLYIHIAKTGGTSMKPHSSHYGGAIR